METTEKKVSMDARAEKWAATANLMEGTHRGDVATAYVIGASDQEVIMNKQSYFKRLEELEYPHREICHLCHRVVAVGFWVPNEIWAAVVHHSHLNAIHCLNCFIERADEKLIDWSKEIKFYAVSLRSHLDSIHDGNDEILPFHIPPTTNAGCQCLENVKTGETSVMCCNICGKPTESFWTK